MIRLVTVQELKVDLVITLENIAVGDAVSSSIMESQISLRAAFALPATARRLIPMDAAHIAANTGCCLESLLRPIILSVRNVLESPGTFIVRPAVKSAAPIGAGRAPPAHFEQIFMK